MRYYRWLGISLLIHAAVILPFMLQAFSTPPKSRAVRLDLELFGMLSDREVEEKLMAGAPELPPNPAPTPAPKPKPKPEEPPVKPVEEPMPVTAAVELPAELADELTEQIIESPVVIPVAFPVAAASASDVLGGSGVFLPSAGTGTGGGGGSGGSDAVNRRGETLRRGRAGDADPISLYTARVARRLQSNLVYPEKLRRKGIEAVTTIMFTVTESGHIKKDSLKVRKSSGYGEMDDNALKAARESAPFDEPPKEMTLVIDVAFEVGRARR